MEDLVYLPEDFDRVVIIVIKTTIVAILLQIVYIDGCIDASNQNLDFLLIEHSGEKKFNMSETEGRGKAPTLAI